MSPLIFSRASRDGGAAMMGLAGHHIEFDQWRPY